MVSVTRETKPNLILIGGVLLAVVLLVSLIYSLLEYDYAEKDAGYQGEARTNAYLAAEFFLLNMGQQAQRIKLFSTNKTLLKSSDTLMVPSIRLAFDRRRSDEMLDWVERGGHLIITGQPITESNSGREDFILEKLGLMIEREALADGSTQDEEQIDVAIDDEDFWKIDLDDLLVVTKKDNFNAQVVWSIEDNDRTHALQILVGRGRVTLLSDMQIFKNDYIDQFDHAAFLFLLSNDQFNQAEFNRAGAGTFYYSLFEDQDSLLQWLWKNAQLFILSFIVTIVIVLWRLMPRFGPLININQPIRRRFSEHLKAAGNYHWRQGNYQHLLHNVRSQLSQKLKIKKPEWSRLSKQAQLRHFADMTQLELEVIERALFSTEIERQDDFIMHIKILEQLRKSL